MALFFFGVPNRGLNIEKLRALVKTQKNEHFINDLGEGSELLRHAHERFLEVVELRSCRIISLFELRDTPSVVVDPSTGHWTRSGEMIRVVARESATYSLPNEAIHMQLGIDADHTNMVKFTDPSDHRYTRVRERLLDCVQSAPSIIESRLTDGGIGGKNEGMCIGNVQIGF